MDDLAFKHVNADIFGLQIRAPYVFHHASERYEIEECLWKGMMDSRLLPISYCTYRSVNPSPNQRSWVSIGAMHAA